MCTMTRVGQFGGPHLQSTNKGFETSQVQNPPTIGCSLFTAHIQAHPVLPGSVVVSLQLLCDKGHLGTLPAD